MIPQYLKTIKHQIECDGSMLCDAERHRRSCYSNEPSMTSRKKFVRALK